MHIPVETFQKREKKSKRILITRRKMMIGIKYEKEKNYCDLFSKSHDGWGNAERTRRASLLHLLIWLLLFIVLSPPTYFFICFSCSSILVCFLMLSLYLFGCLLICLSICHVRYLFTSLSIYLSCFLRVYLSIYQLIYLSVYLFV